MLRLQRVARGMPSALVVGVCALSVFAAVQACGGAVLGENRDDSSLSQGEGEEDEWCTSGRGGPRYRCGGSRGGSGRHSRGGGGSGRCTGRGC